ncbi:MAG: gluconate 2-dehydrogenase subunit 3 family protein [Gemmatimonadetes bacterium]|nr:gluconate 2-dehydrogenase subunit 3 family protein [Gemmatimonadota bacterium]
MLVDLIIPRDERSGSATDAGVPEFMDFIVGDQTGRQTAMRGGLAWLDTECRERFGRDFVAGDEGQRRAVLDDIAWPARARPELSHGVAFFNSFRDLTATGVWSSKMGVEDLGYMGNTVVPEWRGCPDEQLRKLGVSYGD